MCMELETIFNQMYNNVLSQRMIKVMDMYNAEEYLMI